ncbi:hypothetical protein N431DRAFT_531859 [Stipitochalara longipes BDJ]|nr:hypothetical protein N431DRAFT_531859 [Stipitochalara longipes BDJ]
MRFFSQEQTQFDFRLDKRNKTTNHSPELSSTMPSQFKSFLLLALIFLSLSLPTVSLPPPRDGLADSLAQTASGISGTHTSNDPTSSSRDKHSGGSGTSISESGSIGLTIGLVAMTRL